MQILVVEDERRMAELLRRGLTEEGHRVVVARDGAEGFDIARGSAFDVIVLDVMLPRMDGLAVTRRLREARNQTPVLLLTARDNAPDIVNGLDCGADDYLTKPFSFDILLARVRAVSRRGAIPRTVCLEVGDLKLNPATRDVTRGADRINLTPREYGLLELLMRNRGRVVGRDTILDSVWGHGCDVSENTVEAFVRLLRLKVDTREPKLIYTVRGVGYIMREPYNSEPRP
jgi:two-component system response regulator MprA